MTTAAVKIRPMLNWGGRLLGPPELSIGQIYCPRFSSDRAPERTPAIP